MVDDEFSDSSTEGSVSVVTDVSAVHNDRASQQPYWTQTTRNKPGSSFNLFLLPLLEPTTNNCNSVVNPDVPVGGSK